MAPILQDDIMSTPPPESDRINFLSSRYDKVKSVSVPEGLEILMNNLTVHILKAQPQNIHLFAAQHFEKLLYLREKLDAELSEETTGNGSNIAYIVEDNQLTYKTPKVAATDLDKKKNLALVFNSLLSANILFNKSIDNSSNASETSRSKRSANEHLQQIEETNESPTENTEEIEEKPNEDIEVGSKQATEEASEANNIEEQNGVESEKSDNIETKPDTFDDIESEKDVKETNMTESENVNDIDKKSVNDIPPDDTDKEENDKSLEAESILQNDPESERSEEPQSLSEPVTIVESEQVPESESSGETQNISESENVEDSQEGDKIQDTENVGKEIHNELELNKPQEIEVDEPNIKVSQSLSESEPQEEIQNQESQSLSEAALSGETHNLAESHTENESEEEERQNIETDKIEEPQSLTESQEKAQNENESEKADESQNAAEQDSANYEERQNVSETEEKQENESEKVDESQNVAEQDSENGEERQNVSETEEKQENESEKVDESQNVAEQDSENGEERQNVSETEEKLENESEKVDESQNAAEQDSANDEDRQNVSETGEKQGNETEKVDESQNTAEQGSENGEEPQNGSETGGKIKNESGKVNESENKTELDPENINEPQNAVETDEKVEYESKKVDGFENTEEADPENVEERQNVTEIEAKFDTENDSEKIEELQNKADPDSEKNEESHNGKETAEKLESENESEKFDASQIIAGPDSEKGKEPQTIIEREEKIESENGTAKVDEAQNEGGPDSEKSVEAHNDTETEAKLESENESEKTESQNIANPDTEKEKEIENISQLDSQDIAFNEKLENLNNGIANTNETETTTRNENPEQIQNTTESSDDPQTKLESDQHEELQNIANEQVSNANSSETLSINPNTTETLKSMNSEDSEDENHTEEIVGNITKEASVENESGVEFTENADASINKEDGKMDENLNNEIESEKPKFFVGDIDNVIEISSDLQTQNDSKSNDENIDNVIKEKESELSENTNAEATPEQASEKLDFKDTQRTFENGNAVHSETSAEKLIGIERNETSTLEKSEENVKETGDLESNSQLNDSTIQNEALAEEIAKPLDSENMEKESNVIQNSSEKQEEISKETQDNLITEAISGNDSKHLLDDSSNIKGSEKDSSTLELIGNEQTDKSENMTETLKDSEKSEETKKGDIFEETTEESKIIKESDKIEMPEEIVNEELKDASETDVNSTETSQESKSIEKSENDPEEPEVIVSDVTKDAEKMEHISEKTDKDFKSKEISENDLEQSEQVLNEEAAIVEKKEKLSEETVKKSENIKETENDLEKSDEVIKPAIEVTTKVGANFEEASQGSVTLGKSEDIDSALSDDIMEKEVPFEEETTDYKTSEKLENDSEKTDVTSEVQVIDANVKITSQETSDDLTNIGELENDSGKSEQNSEELLKTVLETVNKVPSQTEQTSSVLATEEGTANNDNSEHVENLKDTPQADVEQLDQSSIDADKDEKEFVNVEINEKPENTNTEKQENTEDTEQKGSNETSIDSQIIPNLASEDGNENFEAVKNQNSEHQMLSKLDSENINTKQSEMIPVVEKECVKVILPPKTFQDNEENGEVENDINENQLSATKETNETKGNFEQNHGTENGHTPTKLDNIEINEENKPLEHESKADIANSNVDQSTNKEEESLEAKDEVGQRASDTASVGEKTNHSRENLDIKDANESLSNKNEVPAEGMTGAHDLTAKSNETKDIDSDDDTVVLGTPSFNFSKEDEDTNKNKNDSNTTQTQIESNSQTTENPQGTQFFLGEDNEKQNPKSVQENENEIFPMELDESKNDTEDVDVSSQKSISGLVYENHPELDLDDSGIQPDSLEIDYKPLNHFPNESIDVIHNENDLNNNEIGKVANKIENYEDGKQSRDNTTADTITIDGDYESLESIPEPEILAKISIGSTYSYGSHEDLGHDDDEPSGMSSLTTHIRNINTAVLIIQSAWRKYLKRRNEKKVHSPMVSNNKEQLFTPLLNVNVESNNNVSTNSTVEPPTNSTQIHSNNVTTTGSDTTTKEHLTVSNDLITSLNSNNIDTQEHRIVDNIIENSNDLDTNDADVLNSNEKNSLENLAINDKIETTYSTDSMKLLRQNRPSTAEMNLNKTKENEAATKIQAGFRGYKARKQMKTQLKQQINDTKDITIKKAATGVNEMKTKKVDDMKNIKNEEENVIKKAATTIQANIRGFLTRKKIKSAQEK